jgi:membrane-bound metal-dependent hydrolase YbcI (DUF457 family)
MRLPFTPFHMGAALIVKLGLNRHFSVITFGIAQIAMDIEPGIGMLTGAHVLHGPTHTIVGALVIACLVMLIAPSVCNYLQHRWNKEVIYYKLPWLVQSEALPKSGVIFGAFFGTLSHVALDSLMHHDMHPLMAFSKANPLLGFVSHDGVYQLCAIAGVLGAVAWLTMKWVGRSPQVDGNSVAPDPLVIEAPQSTWAIWVQELQSAWLWMFFLSVVPGFLYGTGFFSMVALTVVVLIFAPFLAISQLRGKGSGEIGLRRLVVMVLVPVLSMAYVFHIDKQIPDNATPITHAVESFRALS